MSQVVLVWNVFEVITIYELYILVPTAVNVSGNMVLATGMNLSPLPPVGCVGLNYPRLGMSN